MANIINIDRVTIWAISQNNYQMTKEYSKRVPNQETVSKILGLLKDSSEKFFLS